MDSNEFYKFEDQAYVNPTLSSGEQEGFINNLRDIQNRNNQQIATDTYNLGKALPSNLGGLGGGESYFNSRYQTDQVDDLVANLKTAAQAQSLNDVMTNYKNQLTRRYNKAQQAYNRRRASSAGNSLEDTLRKLLDAGGTTDGDVDEQNISGRAAVLGEGDGISASPSDVPLGELYSTIFTGAIDANGNPITKKGTTTFNSKGQPIWSDDPQSRINQIGGSYLDSIFYPTTLVRPLK